MNILIRVMGKSFIKEQFMSNVIQEQMVVMHVA